MHDDKRQTDMIALYEKVMKSLYRLSSMTDDAVHGAVLLDDKTRMSRLQKYFLKAKDELTLKRFDIEDAQKFKDDRRRD